MAHLQCYADKRYSKFVTLCLVSLVASRPIKTVENRSIRDQDPSSRGPGPLLPERRYDIFKHLELAKAGHHTPADA